MNLDALLRAAAGQLTDVLGLDADTARLEARVLAGHALQKPRAWLVAHGQEALPPEQLETVRAMIQRRLQGEPVAYILGRREFFGLDLLLTPDVLIPRPETELLVQLALDRLPPERPATVLDLGTGSGAVALAIAAHRTRVRVMAVDCSDAALRVARRNAQYLGLENVEFSTSHWYAQLGVKKFDIIVSNPPYIAQDDPHLAQGDLRFEPRAALASGVDGLADIRHIVTGAPAHLLPGGWLLFEHGYDQENACKELLTRQGWSNVHTWQDLAGLPRVTGGQTPCSNIDIVEIFYIDPTG